MREVGAAGVLNESPGHARVEAVQVLDYAPDLVGLAQRVVGKAELVPRVRIHGLERGDALEGPDGLAVPLEGRERQPQTVPGAVEPGVEPHGVLKSLDGARGLAAPIEEKSEVEPGGGVAGLKAQDEAKVPLGLLGALPGGEQVGERVRRPGEARVAFERQAVLGDGPIRPPEDREQTRAQEMTPGRKIHVAGTDAW